MKNRKRVLLLEDDPGTRTLLRKLLLRVDPLVAVVTADSAELAYLILNESQWDGTRFDLVMADVNLPGSTGLRLWEIVARRFPVQFLFISGMGTEAWLRQTEAIADRLHFLPKPIREEDLRLFWESKVAAFIT